MIRYAITDRALFAGSEEARLENLVARAAGWASQQIDYIQIRERDLLQAGLLRLATSMVQAVRENSQHTQVLFHAGHPASASIFIASGADGLHLPGVFSPEQLTETINRLRRELRRQSDRRDAVPISVSCHSSAEVRAARAAGATLALFAPVFEKTVAGKLVREGTGLALLAEACRAAREPAPWPEILVCALGGVTRDNASETIAAGADGIAGIRLFASGSSLL